MAWHNRAIMLHLPTLPLDVLDVLDVVDAIWLDVLLCVGMAWHDMTVKRVTVGKDRGEADVPKHHRRVHRRGGRGGLQGMHPRGFRLYRR